jgi:hypothetical protein
MRKVLACAVLVSLLAGCVGVQFGGKDQVKGSGNRKTEEREVGDFDSIEVNGAYKLEVTNGKGGALEIEADDNLLPLVKTEVSGRRLRISNDRGFNTQELPRVRLSVPDLKEVALSGASDFSLSGLANDRLKINTDGASKLRATGETGALEVSLNGAGTLDARELRARTARVVSNGAGTVSVYASDSLDATVNGVGSIDYYGDPKTVNPKVNGVGKITKK